MTTSAAEQLSTVSLYERLGGSTGIRRIVDGMVDAHLDNPAIKPRFTPYLDQPDRVEKIKQHYCTLFEELSNGPGAYDGRSMHETHRGMNIDETEYIAAMDDILETMKSLGHAEDTRKEIAAMLYALKDDIVRV
ncbi:group I truncated hemoglobin [Roseivivax sediminis]|uniref:Hemoglobin n=1 Tax=Roseivivax sediminis TaxID=936889 RepID=A0A1I2C9D7_9RHOB|nr:group 1 truncated hemoglobin [Roseivivax sediminis]SFE64946.1 hemoglobin [Roseivivax sediminis]